MYYCNLKPWKPKSTKLWFKKDWYFVVIFWFFDILFILKFLSTVEVDKNNKTMHLKRSNWHFINFCDELFDANSFDKRCLLYHDVAVNAFICFISLFSLWITYLKVKIYHFWLMWKKFVSKMFEFLIKCVSCG